MAVPRGDVAIRPASADAVRPLRHAVLRPHQPPEALVYAGDDTPGALHLTATDAEETVVGVATLSREPHPHGGGAGDWRLRGMATAPEVRGTGVGARLLEACLDHAREHGGARVWCHARSPAQAFYRRGGFTAEGDEYELDGIGPHLLMARPV